MTPATDDRLTEELPPPAPDAHPLGEQPVGAPPESPPGVAPTTHREPPTRTGWHVVAIVVGIVMMLPALGAVAAGTTLVVAQQTATDDGFFDVTIDRIESDGVAVATVGLWDATDDPDAPWVLDWLDVDVRLDVEGARDTTDVFVGIGRTADITDYLTGSAHAEITGFDDRTPRYRQVDGAGIITAPDSVDIWDVSSSGDDDREITWEVRSGDWSVVVMNADGSSGVAADVEVGIRSGAVMPIGIVLIVFGGIGLLAGTALIVVGARGRR